MIIDQIMILLEAFKYPTNFYIFWIVRNI